MTIYTILLLAAATQQVQSFFLPQRLSTSSISSHRYQHREHNVSSQRKLVQLSHTNVSRRQPHRNDDIRNSNIINYSSKKSKIATTIPHAPLSKEEQESHLKCYNEYKRIQSTLSLQGESSLSLNEQAQQCGYDISNLREFQRILQSGPQTKELLILHNIGLVHYVVQQILSSPSGKNLRSLSRDDLIQEGTIGLSRALEKYSYSPTDATIAKSSSSTAASSETSASFSTYAVYWIRASILRCIAQREELVRVPEHVTVAIKKVNEAVNDLGLLGFDEGIENISAKTLSYEAISSTEIQLIALKAGLTESMVQEALQVQKRRQMSRSKGSGYVELQDWMLNDQGNAVQRRKVLTGGQDDVYNPSVSLDRESQLEYVKDILGSFLSGKEMEALSWRYGLKKLEQTCFKFYDYEAEAEEDIFGPGGILSSEVRKATFSPFQQSSTLQSSQQTTMLSRSKTSTRQKQLKTSSSRPQRKGGRWGEAMSFAEVGEQMRVSAEYGRRLCSSALKKLQMAAEEGRLDPALLF